MLTHILNKRLAFCDRELQKVKESKGGRVNDDSFLQAWAEKRLISDIQNCIAASTTSDILPRSLANPMYRDELTGALNMLAWHLLDLDNMQIHVTVIDVDDLREDNKQMGYSAGDQILCELVKVLADQGMVVFRVWGDYFAAYMREDLKKKIDPSWILDWKL